MLKEPTGYFEVLSYLGPLDELPDQRVQVPNNKGIWGYIRIMGKKMATTTMGSIIWFRVSRGFKYPIMRSLGFG